MLQVFALDSSAKTNKQKKDSPTRESFFLSFVNACSHPHEGQNCPRWLCALTHSPMSSLSACSQFLKCSGRWLCALKLKYLLELAMRINTEQTF